jgi:hypothetical protein
MTVPCQVTTAEMREAFRLNLNSSSVFKIMRGNARVIIYVLVFLAVIVAEIRKSGAIDWQEVAILGGVIALLLLLSWFRIQRTLAKTAAALTATCSSMTIDTQGITVEATNGTRTQVPWSAIVRWHEGKLVFTIGDAKAYRTVSKSALGEMQSGELRSLLLAQIR